MSGLVSRSAEGNLLSCSGITPLVGQADSPLPLVDTTDLHAHSAAERALALP